MTLLRALIHVNQGTLLGSRAMDHLNAFEREILKHIADGKSAAEISAALGVPSRAVMHQSAILFLKLARACSQRTPGRKRAN